MNRRDFLSLSASGIAALGLTGPSVLLEGKNSSRKGGRYSVVILGDTHFDKAPDTIYHSCYDEPNENLSQIQRGEFARNGEMWSDRCPRLLARAAGLIDDSTRFALQVGDLIQGDCGNGDVHRRMLSDAMDYLKANLKGLPFVTVVGNHDIRGTDAKEAYHEYMPARMSAELGMPIRKTTFSFPVGDDAWIVTDFNDPDDEEMDKLLKETEGARYTFIVTHSAVFPLDGLSFRWFYQGSAKRTGARLHFREEFARRNAIVLCGHTHRTEFHDWYGDGGRITQMTCSSVWANEELGHYGIDVERPEQYGLSRRRRVSPDDPANKDAEALYDEYRPGLRQYIHAYSAGSYRLDVSRRGVTVDFYAGDSQDRTARFILR